ncbi:hypothetical protein K458DRAFT_482724 [Lentithecium fluviatile CBS 122367]|uniref:Uncharacterized protein n=1 Tax=Lentithecium fluviatile CBS 122367 TaxID=1168545 RepID=A0A6G1JNK1_9PLEO|nr:hypothetical protein K458DRAFT_482724 [Lentithecium fluviatile CBS 122367]
MQLPNSKMGIALVALSSWLISPAAGNPFPEPSSALLCSSSAAHPSVPATILQKDLSASPSKSPSTPPYPTASSPAASGTAARSSGSAPGSSVVGSTKVTVATTSAQTKSATVSASSVKPSAGTTTHSNATITSSKGNSTASATKPAQFTGGADVLGMTNVMGGVVMAAIGLVGL